jgi:RNA polymerase sigma-70 factor (ECF subfamily)
MTEQAFQRLYDATSGPILGYLTAVTGHRDIAEDLLQETFIRLLARPRPTMDADETRRYLLRIATNLLRDRWRRNDHQPFTEPAEPSHTPSTDTSIEIRSILQRLKPRERELLWLAYVEGMDHREIAAATGLQPLSIRLLLHRARKKAAVLLQPGNSKTRTNQP